MIDYDFSTLNDKEFEALCVDLLSAEFGKQFTRFKSGRDGGIDGRFFTSDGSTEIIQCKHYLKSGFDSLFHTLKNIEQPKVNKLSPQKYYVVTSVPLSPDNKTKIRALFVNYIPNDDCIIGQEHLNILLSKYPEIEKKYFKLWLSSVNLLSTILHNAIISRSDSFVNQVKDKSKFYVFSNIITQATKILKEKNTVIIEGEPGIGKSTLAEMLILIEIKNKYKIYKIENLINEAEAVLSTDDEEKQLFYFDDFLGSNYLTAIENHKDSHIVNFIKRISKSKNKKFILTSRTNIIQKAKSLSDKLNNAKINQNEYVLSVTQLSEMNKAKILYNHIWHSNLPENYIDQLYIDKRYLKIIKHKNFNPRIIEFITDIDRLYGLSANQYWAQAEEKLNNPAEIWANTFDIQSNDYIRILVLLVVFSNGKIEEQKLINSYNKESKTINKTETQNTDFQSSIRIANNYFINRSVDLSSKTVIYSLFNPSITDFILARYQNESDTIYNMLDSLRTADSVAFVCDAGTSNKLNENIVKVTLIKLFNNLISNLDINHKYLFLIKLINEIKFEITKYEDIGKAIIEIVSNKLKLPYTAINELVSILNVNEISSHLIQYKDNIVTYILEQFCNEAYSFNSKDIRAFIDLVNKFDISNPQQIENINYFLNNEFLPYHLESLVNSNININDVSLWTDELEVVEDTIWSYVNESKQIILNEIGEFPYINIDEDKFISAINIEYLNDMLIKQHCQSYEDDDEVFSNDEYINNIEQLFERNS